MVTQRGMINHLFAKMGTLQLQSTDTIAQTAAASFDISVWQFLAALLVGGRVCIFPDEIAHDPGLLWGRISEQGITVLELVPSLLQTALDTLDNSMEKTALNLHWMLVTGEACPMGLVNRWGECCPQIPLVNAYGPTECSDDVTQAVLVPTTDMQIQTAPIGRPLANTQIYLLDEQMRPVPIGVPGEIYVGGVGVGRGYLSDSVRTALAFVPHPFVAGAGLIPASCTSPYPGERLYRTGDMARYRNNGEIEFIGRRDQQVKLHGFRIELGEIEATLMRHVAVREAVVLAQEDSSGEKRLVAYVVTEAGSAQGTGWGQAPSAPTAPALHSYLQEHLPAYMIPTLIVPLDALPLTPNGKVDRKALPVPERGKDFKNTETASGRPQTPLQEQLALIWAELLHVQEIGIYDNFFELGGHSLLAVQLLNRINKQFGPWRRARGLQALSLAALFQAPTIEQVSTLLQTSVGSLSTSPLVTLRPVEQTHRRKARPPLFCIHDGMGFLSSFFRLVKHLRHDRPYYGIQAPALRGDGGLFNSVEEIATSYIDELLAVQPPASPYFLMGYSLGGLVAFEMARQLQAQGRSVALLAILDTQPDPQDTTVEMGQAIVLEQLLEIVEALVHSKKEEELLPYEELYRLQPDEQLAYFLEKLVEAKVVPEDMDIAQLRRYRQIYEMHDICFKRYRPQPYLGRITLFRSEDGEIDPSLWIPVSSEPIEVHTVSGNHNTIVVEPYVQSLAAQLQQCLDKADGVDTSSLP